MRLRSKLFITSSLVVLLLGAGTLWPIQRLVGSTFNHLANSNFNETRAELRSLQAEHIDRMRQDGKMLMEIPELRALIAEHNFEVSADNLNSLRERLDNLGALMGVPFVCVSDARGSLIAQNASSPWATLNDLRTYVANSAQAQPLVQRLFPAGSGTRPSNQGEYGLWLYQGQLFQVVGLPLVFDADQSTSKVDGALIMAAPITGAFASELASSHGCEISFLTSDGGMASSLRPQLATSLRQSYDRHVWPTSATFDTELGGATYRSYLEPLVDPCSGSVVGATVIQSSMADWNTLQRRILTSLIAIMSAGLLVAAWVSFMLSDAITRPIRQLVGGVKRVAEGDLNSVIVIRHRDEIGELASAFNDMVAQLRARRELERLVEESQAANKAKSQFLANMSHEIRTPLHGVIGMANLLLSTDLNERQRHYAQLVCSSTEVLTTLINDILDFSKIEAGKLELETVEFDLHSVVEDVVELLYQKAIAKGVELACEIEPAVPVMISGDPTRLRQMLLNLIGNSVKFTQAGQIIVRVSLDAARSDAMLLRFDITDTGIGIPPDRVGLLFQSFCQVDPSTTRRFGGTGLGLAISKQLVELMGGTIGVESELGKGSRFWFTVNVRAAAAAERKSYAAVAGIRVLIAEANAALRGILARQLADAGVNASAIGSGEEIDRAIATADAERKPFRFVFVSRSVPQLAKVMEAARSHKIELILLSTTAADERPQGLREAGFSAVVAKPVRRVPLLAALSTAMGVIDHAPQKAAISDQSPVPRSGRLVRVLVAEDNEINQIVAAEFLRKVGFESRIVNDGQSAVKAFLEGQYDLVLMDCQMPVMDGFEATGEIRRHERAMEAAGKPVRKVPIIALTANASGADRGRCMEAGMDAYCGKPFREKDLLDTFAMFLKADEPVTSLDAANGTTAAPTRDASPASTTDESPIQTVLSAAPTGANAPTHADAASPADPASAGEAPFTLGALRDRCSGNAALALTILNKFEKQLGEATAQIETSLQAGNSAEIARVSHALKGTAGVLAAESLRISLAELEQYGRQQALNLAANCFTRLQVEITRCTAYVSHARTELEADSRADCQKDSLPCKS